MLTMMFYKKIVPLLLLLGCNCFSMEHKSHNVNRLQGNNVVSPMALQRLENHIVQLVIDKVRFVEIAMLIDNDLDIALALCDEFKKVGNIRGLTPNLIDAMLKDKIFNKTICHVVYHNKPIKDLVLELLEFELREQYKRTQDAPQQGPTPANTVPNNRYVSASTSSASSEIAQSMPRMSPSLADVLQREPVQRTPSPEMSARIEPSVLSLSPVNNARPLTISEHSAFTRIAPAPLPNASPEVVPLPSPESVTVSTGSAVESPVSTTPIVSPSITTPVQTVVAKPVKSPSKQALDFAVSIAHCFDQISFLRTGSRFGSHDELEVAIAKLAQSGKLRNLPRQQIIKTLIDHLSLEFEFESIKTEVATQIDQLLTNAFMRENGLIADEEKESKESLAPVRNNDVQPATSNCACSSSTLRYYYR
jgi:hypothetical protein